MHKLLRPKAIQLILFSIVLIPILYYYTTDSLFDLFLISGFLKLFFFTGIFFIATLLIDLRFKTRICRYSIVSAGLLIITIIASIAINNYKQAKTEKLGLVLSEKIEDYKKLNEHYPENLSISFFDTVPKLTAWGYAFGYRKYNSEKGEERFELQFYGLSGMGAYLYPNRTKWIYMD